MRQKRSKRKIMDNSGVRERRCIGRRKKLGMRKGSVTEYRRGTKWQRGIRVKGVAVGLRKEKQRRTGSWVRQGMNCGRVVNAKGDPRGQRTRRCRLGERRGKGITKLRARSVYEV